MRQPASEAFVAPCDPVRSRRAPGPFDPGAETAYREWRAAKLRDHPPCVSGLTVPVADPRALTPVEHAALADRCRRTNMAVYMSPIVAADKAIPPALARQFGLTRLDGNWLADDDGISSVTVTGKGGRADYIPYTNRPIRWHTDGYYNPPARRIWAFVLHCVSSAAAGGENALLDHEIAYLLMRDADPRLVDALMQPDAMTIPARTDGEGTARPAETGPVFFVHPVTGALHMRYTARTRSIEWKDDPPVRAAVSFLERLLASPSPYIHRLTLQPGMGLLCNNVLHNRAGFPDDPARPRLLYRARYYDRIGRGGA